MDELSRVTDATLDVIEVLMGPDEQLYGLKISQLAGRKTGVVYPILARLEDSGWVVSDWERAERDRGPRRRFYRLSGGGLTAARDLLVERRGAIRQRTARPGTRRARPLIPAFPDRHGST
jgi:PadR family transcriptional regulator PadR